MAFRNVNNSLLVGDKGFPQLEVLDHIVVGLVLSVMVGVQEVNLDHQGVTLDHQGVTLDHQQMTGVWLGVVLDHLDQTFLIMDMEGCHPQPLRDFLKYREDSLAEELHVGLDGVSEGEGWPRYLEGVLG